LAAFQFLKDYIVIFGKSGAVVDYNPSANKWFSSLGIDLREHGSKSLIKKLKELGATIVPAMGESAGNDISLVVDDFPVILNMRTFELSFKDRGKQGTIAFFFDVTQNRELFEKLEKKAGYDMLSGLPNRMSYEGAKQRYDAKENLPLTVIIADLNDLKKVNDTLGHKYGDLFIQTASDILDKECQQPLFAARLGGDEFVMLMPNTDEKAAEEQIKKIKAGMADRSKNLPFSVSMAMGAATKHLEMESLDDLITEADKRLYNDKRVMKGQPPR
jgi:diguanylate cyclase (GGDEF)-like protein